MLGPLCDLALGGLSAVYSGYCIILSGAASGTTMTVAIEAGGRAVIDAVVRGAWCTPDFPGSDGCCVVLKSPEG